MVQTFLLILVVAVSNNGVSTSTTEFNSRSACTAAGKAVKEKFTASGASHTVDFVCVAKS